MIGSLSIQELDGARVLTVSEKETNKAIYTQEGTTRMPSRKWLGLNRGNAQRMAKLKDAFVTAWRKYVGY